MVGYELRKILRYKMIYFPQLMEASASKSPSESYTIDSRLRALCSAVGIAYASFAIRQG